MSAREALNHRKRYLLVSISAVNGSTVGERVREANVVELVRLRSRLMMFEQTQFVTFNLNGGAGL